MKKCKHRKLVRLDGDNRPVERHTPANNITEHFACEDCELVFISLMGNKPMIVEQVAVS